MEIGVFIPIGNNGWIISTTSPQYMPSFELNREIVRRAERYGLDNLTAILDWNGLQQYGWATEAGYGVLARRPAQENPAAKWQAFGWATIEIDGHDLSQVLDACARAKAIKGRPTLIIARTVKGKGISYMENDFNWHSKPVTDEDLRVAREELAAQEAAL